MEAVFLLVQHADRDPAFQSAMPPEFAVAHRSGAIPGQSLSPRPALLYLEPSPSPTGLNMDAGSLALMIPIVAIGAGAMVKVAKIRAAAGAVAMDPQAAERLATLEDEVGRLGRELAEAQERLDFTERLLARQRSDQLSPPA